MFTVHTIKTMHLYADCRADKSRSQCRCSLLRRRVRGGSCSDPPPAFTAEVDGLHDGNSHRSFAGG